MKSIFAFFCFSILFNLPSLAQIQQGEASYYKDFFEGRKTASGELFQQALPTAAHRSLSFGTIVRITNKHNGKSTKVRINDRGPYIRKRIIDVSKSVAERLDFVDKGTTIVEIEVINFADAESFYFEMDMLETKTEAITYQEVEAVERTNNNTIFTEDEKVEVEVSKVVEQNTAKKEVKKNTTNDKKKQAIDNEVIDIVRRVETAEKALEVEKSEEISEPQPKPKTTKRKPNLSEVNATPIDKNKEKGKEELLLTDVAEQLILQIQKHPKAEQFFNLKAEPIQPNFFAIQVASLSNASNTLDLGRKLENFYQQKIILHYKLMNDKGLFSLAVGEVQTRTQAEDLLEKIKERYPYAFILNLKTKP